MSYPTGTYVVDQRRNRLGRVMGSEGPYIQLRPPGGGQEWDCPPDATRPATESERRAAGIAANGTD
ncbi:hypothetical protein [Streptomyces hygroscopicus]|nr:hypothetical protein [Streptomyces hygroscopicus]